MSIMFVLLALTMPLTTDTASADTASADTASADTASEHHPDHDEPLPEDTGDTLNPVVGIPPNAGRIIGSPEPGPLPTHQGDRGGYLQLATLAALIGGLGFIAWKVTRSTHTRAG